MDCERKETNIQNCTCTYSGCDKKGVCCQCLQYHLGMKQLPGCAFPADAERAYDRSFKAFAKAWNL